MKVFLLADANSIHTVKWVKGLAEKGVLVGLWSLSKPKGGIYEDVNNLKLYYAGVPQERFGWINKIQYLSVVSHLRKAIRDFQPQLLHAHFASSYGLLGALAKFSPYIVSVWGADIFDFPNKNIFFKEIIKFNLRKANKILSTSHVMAAETAKYTDKPIEVTPFGIDLDVFKKLQARTPSSFTIGTVKTLEKKYGIDYLIDAFKIFSDRYPLADVKMLIVGGGTLEKQLKKKVKDIGLLEKITFTGSVPFSEAAFYHNQLDVCLCLSILDSESFGVSAVEASATETPVIVSNVGGLPEVIVDNQTGIVVPARNALAAADAIEKLYLDPELRRSLGKAGRKRVEELYDWDKNVDQMINIYSDLLNKPKKDK